MRNAARRTGYTLVELMMVVAILGIIASAGPLLLRNLQDFFLMTTARNEIERDARSSLDTINRFIRQAVDGTIAIDTPPSGGGPYSRIRFTDIEGRSISFYQSGSNLMMSVNSDQSTLSKDLGFIAFTFPRTDDPTIVSVAMTMTKDIQLGRKKVLELTIQNVRVMN